MENTHQPTTVLKLDEGQEEQCFKLWDTPIVLCKPFDKAFMAQLKKDVEPIVKGPGQFNHTDIWALPDLPDTLIAVRDKIIELGEKYYRPYCETPMSPFRISKGYFRETKPGAYRMSPHKHSFIYGVSCLYIEADPRNPGNLTLMDPRGGVTWLNQFSPYKRIPVEEGLLVIHPGYVLHYVEPTDYDRPVYDYRLALISGLTRHYNEFLQALKENETTFQSFGANGMPPMSSQN